MNTPKLDDFQSYNGNHLVDDELNYSQEKKKGVISRFVVYVKGLIKLI